jgi:UDP-N-acetylglucosamine--N-acetylmuramyl-(pentapeptide) pyrophosphoryl-undecaprenol N-acetylglucosamine transferase
MKVLISGGHLTPALALIDYIQEFKPDVDIVFIGRQFARAADGQRSLEEDETAARSVPFYPLDAGKLGQRSLAGWISQGIRFLKSLPRAYSLVRALQPTVAVSFGGYLAVPVSLACWLQRIPVITHEQTRSVGISNQLISRVAAKVAVSYPESAKYFPPHKVSVTGNLIRKQLTIKRPAAPGWWRGDLSLPLLYVTGGSQGSEVLNATVSQCLPRLLRQWSIVHQCGGATKHRNYREELEARRSQLSKNQQQRYIIKDWISDRELAWIYRSATAVVSRAGANTTLELTYHRLPSVLVPLPFSHHREQQRNAEALAAVGGAILLPQKTLTPDSLIEALETIRSRHQSFRRKLEQIDIPIHADREVFALVEEVAPAHHQEKKTAES